MLFYVVNVLFLILPCVNVRINLYGRIYLSMSVSECMLLYLWHLTFLTTKISICICFASVIFYLKICFRALARNNEHMGKRYVEVFESKRSEMDWCCKRDGGNSDERDNRVLRLRGLPYGCSKEEVANFFNGRFILIF